MRRVLLFVLLVEALIAIGGHPAFAFKMLRSGREAANDADAVAPGIQKGRREAAPAAPSPKERSAPQPKGTPGR